jgi:hypothetical protein
MMLTTAVNGFSELILEVFGRSALDVCRKGWSYLASAQLRIGADIEIH